MSSDFDSLDLGVSTLKTVEKSLLGALSGSRFVRFLVDNEFTQYTAPLPSGLASELVTLHNDPLRFAEAPPSDAMLAAVREWLDQFDDEPEGDDYFSYQAAVVIEYLLQFTSAQDPTAPLLRMIHYCVDFAYFLDQDLDLAEKVHEKCERAFWVMLVEGLSSERSGSAVLVEASKADELRLVQAARDVMCRRT